MTPRLVVSHTACVYGLSVEELQGPSRSRSVQQARGVAAYLAYERTAASYAEIGRELARKRQGVAQLIERVCERLTTDGELAQAIERVEAELR